jgi:hypothetical protein
MAGSLYPSWALNSWFDKNDMRYEATSCYQSGNIIMTTIRGKYIPGNAITAITRVPGTDRQRCLKIISS